MKINKEEVDVECRVERLKELLKDVSDADRGDVGASAGFALKAVEVSSSRIDISGTRLRAKAITTVASSSMSVVAAAVNRGRLRKALILPVVEIAEIVLSLADAFAKPEHKKLESASAPFRWTGREGGPFQLDGPNDLKYQITHRPGLPGGSWCLYVSGVPVCGAIDQNEAARKADKFSTILTTGRALAEAA